MRRAALPLLLLFPLLLAGCGGSTPASPDAGSTGTAPASAVNPGSDKPTNTCPEQARVGSALAATYDAPDVTNGETGVVCMYKGHKVADNEVSVAMVMIRSDAQAEMDQLRKDEAGQGYTIKDVSGLGDEAFTWEVTGFKTPTVNVTARIGDRQVYIAADATLDQVVALVRQLL
jgi:hypothetical protein